MSVEEQAFTVDEAKAAAELFITSATSLVTAVTHLDDAPIGAARPGPTARRLREAYVMERQAA